jgi:hypothetical protein
MTDSSNRKLPFCGFQTGQLFSFFNKLPYASPYSLIQLKRGGGAHAADMTTGQKGGLLPNPIDQNPWAHWRSPMDMMRQG